MRSNGDFIHRQMEHVHGQVCAVARTVWWKWKFYDEKEEQEESQNGYISLNGGNSRPGVDLFVAFLNNIIDIYYIIT